MTYLNKYIKYKNKYLLLKGGSDKENEIYNNSYKKIGCEHQTDIKLKILNYPDDKITFYHTHMIKMIKDMLEISEEILTDDFFSQFQFEHILEIKLILYTIILTDNIELFKLNYIKYYFGYLINNYFYLFMEFIITLDLNLDYDIIINIIDIDMIILSQYDIKDYLDKINELIKVKSITSCDRIIFYQIILSSSFYDNIDNSDYIYILLSFYILFYQYDIEFYNFYNTKILTIITKILEKEENKPEWFNTILDENSIYYNIINMLTSWVDFMGSYNVIQLLVSFNIIFKDLLQHIKNKFEISDNPLIYDDTYEKLYLSIHGTYLNTASIFIIPENIDIIFMTQSNNSYYFINESKDCNRYIDDMIKFDIATIYKPGTIIYNLDIIFQEKETTIHNTSYKSGLFKIESDKKCDNDLPVYVTLTDTAITDIETGIINIENYITLFDIVKIIKKNVPNNKHVSLFVGACRIEYGKLYQSLYDQICAIVNLDNCQNIPSANNFKRSHSLGTIYSKNETEYNTDQQISIIIKNILKLYKDNPIIKLGDITKPIPINKVYLTIKKFKDVKMNHKQISHFGNYIEKFNSFYEINTFINKLLDPN